MSERGNNFLRRLDCFLGIPLTVPAAILRKTLLRPVGKSASPARIGILCLGAIGDLLLVSALANGIRKKLPHAAIELVASSANRQALPLVGDACNYAAFPVSHAGRILAYVRRQKYDILFDSSQWSRIGNLICNLSGAAITVGFSTNGQYRSAGYNIKVPHSPKIHELENFLALGRGVWPDFSGAVNLKIAGKGASKATGRIVYLHMWPAPGRGRNLKQWPEEHWAELARQMRAAGFQIRLTGSAGDARANDYFKTKYFKNEDNIQSIAGSVDIPALAEMLSVADAVISVNTGIMHLAALAGAPTVGLHGATNPLRWGPLGPRSVALVPDRGQHSYLDLGFEYPVNAEESMRHISVEKVMVALAELGVI